MYKKTQLFQSLSLNEPLIADHTKTLNKIIDSLYQEQNFSFDQARSITIITPKHTVFVAHLLYRALVENGFKIQIETTLPEKFNDNLHIMICPQIFDRMPEHYIAFQMEQLESSQWFNESYRIILQNSSAIFDYSIQNIVYLQSHGFSKKCLFHLPISPYDRYQQFLLDYGHWDGGKTDTCDVLFYGDSNSERRQNYLRALQQRFSVKIINEVFGNDLYRELLSAKVIVNIHYYENALLETTRIYECLSLGLRVVSEESSDMEEHLTLLNQVDFVRMGDIDHMIEKIAQVLDKDEKKEKVSVIIPCYNQAEYLNETVQSVLDQTYPNKEIIIINDGSTDKSEKIAEEIIRDYPDKNILLMNQANKGLSEARNSGIRASSGDYVFVLDGDDKLHDTTISKCMCALREQDVDIVYGDYQRFGEETSVQKTGDKIELYSLLYANVTGATALYRKSVWEKTGGYKQNMSGGYEDWEFWINVTKNGFKFYHIPEVLFYYRVKKESMYTDAYKKDAYLRTKIVMNHPELYTSEQADNAICTIKETEKLPDLYFLTTDALLLSNQKIRINLGDYLANNILLEKQIFPVNDTDIGLCTIDTFENLASIEKLSKELGVKQILFYAPLRYEALPLQCLDLAWSHVDAFVPSRGTIFTYVAQSARENIGTKLLAYQGSERFLREKCHILEQNMGHYSQLFLNLGKGYNETDSIKLSIHKYDQSHTFTFNLADYTNLTDIRLDPLNDSCVIEIEELKILHSDNTKLDLLPLMSTNDCAHEGKSYYFETMDPTIHFKGLYAENLEGTTHLVATIQFHHIGRKALEVSTNQMLLAKDIQIRALQDTLNLIDNGKSWSYAILLRKIKKLKWAGK